MVVCICGFCNERLCVCVSFLFVIVCMCGVCNVRECVCVGFFIRMCVCVFFVTCGCV